MANEMSKKAVVTNPTITDAFQQGSVEGTTTASEIQWVYVLKITDKGMPVVTVEHSDLSMAISEMKRFLERGPGIVATIEIVGQALGTQAVSAPVDDNEVVDAEIVDETT